MYLGIDLGTSSVKALLIDDQQNIVASGTSPLQVLRPARGHSEQLAEDWIKATEQAIDQIAASKPAELSALRGIGLSGQQHGATLLDSENNVLRPCILWNDSRAEVQAGKLNANPAFAKICGNVVFPGFTAPKINWCAEHEPDIRAKVAKVLLPKDYLRLWLSGECVSEMSDASGTAWLDVGNRCWSDTLLAESGLSIDNMPTLVEGCEPSAQLRAELARRWNINSAVVIAGGAGDNAASACGMGTVQPNAAFASLGTSGVLFVSNSEYLPNAERAVHTFCHALPGRWHQMGVILAATDSLNWFSGITGVSPEALTAELPDQLQAPVSVTFLPYLSGERTPHNDAQIRGSFTGLGTSTSRNDLTLAVLQGVSFAFRDSLNALQLAGTELNRVTAVGGGSRSGLWLQMLATTLQLPIDVSNEGDTGAAFGAARLGLIASENLDPASVCTPPPVSHTIEPDKNLSQAYDQAWQSFRSLYPALKGHSQ